MIVGLDGYIVLPNIPLQLLRFDHPLTAKLGGGQLFFLDQLSRVLGSDLQPAGHVLNCEKLL